METAMWRIMTVDDLPSVVAVAGQVHLDYPERAEVFAERLALFPAGARIAIQGTAIVGYGLMHPARSRHPPALDSFLGRLRDDADVLYLHDIALMPLARGLGLGRTILAYACDLARACDYQRLALTSTPQANAYWHRQGFSQVGGDAALDAKLGSYGGDMAYMERSLA